MLEQTLFCNPGDTYRGMTEEEVAREYTRMSMDEFDKLVCFHEDYVPFQGTPDITGTIRKKSGRKLRINAFLSQRVTQIGRVKDNFATASYIFGFNSSEGLMLPDLEVVQVRGLPVEEAVEELIKFYKEHGWQPFVSGKEFGRGILEFKERGPLSFVDTELLLQTAVDESDYNIERLYFGQ